MPKRFITFSRTEPARTILFTVGVLTIITQVGFVALNFAFGAIPNMLFVVVMSGWAVASAHRASVKHMALSSFWLFVMWMWSALARLLVSPDPGLMLWAPMFTVAMCMAVVYLYLSNQRRQGY